MPCKYFFDWLSILKNYYYQLPLIDKMIVNLFLYTGEASSLTQPTYTTNVIIMIKLLFTFYYFQF